MAGTTYVYTKETNNHDYLFVTFGDNIEVTAKGIFLEKI